jgi:hypothetical protein
MPNPPGRGATHNLTRLGLVLSHRRARGDWLGRCALALAGLLIGAAAGYGYASRPLDDSPQRTAAAQERQRLQQRLEQGQLTLRVSEARSQELERQIATLVKQLRESQDELTFFRKARDGKR